MAMRSERGGSQLPRQKLQFVLGALANLGAWELAGDVLQKIPAEATLLSWALGEIKPKRKNILRIQAFVFSERF